MPRVWFITGCSSGFGRAITLAAAAQGDAVVATARNVSALEELKKQQEKLPGTIITKALDVLASDEKISAVIDDVLQTVGPIDVLVNNAGYILVGAIEECSADEILSQFHTNVFGQLALLRAVLPSMRQRSAGTIANLGSIGGWAGAPAAGIYCASKAAIAIYTDALRKEVAPFGIRVTCIEPGYFRTAFLEENKGRQGGKTVAAKRIPELAESTDAARERLQRVNGNQPGDPDKAAKIIVQALTGTGMCSERELPPRLAVGKDAVGFIGGALDRSREDLEAWKDIVTLTDFDG